jgi:hypothetical protein
MACSWTALALATLISQISYRTDVKPNLYHNFLTDRFWFRVIYCASRVSARNKEGVDSYPIKCTGLTTNKSRLFPPRQDILKIAVSATECLLTLCSTNLLENS